MEFRLLYFEGCPGWEKTKENLDEVLVELKLNTTYDTLNVTQGNLPNNLAFRQLISEEVIQIPGKIYLK